MIVHQESDSRTFILSAINSFVRMYVQTSTLTFGRWPRTCMPESRSDIPVHRPKLRNVLRVAPESDILLIVGAASFCIVPRRRVCRRVGARMLTVNKFKADDKRLVNTDHEHTVFAVCFVLRAACPPQLLLAVLLYITSHASGINQLNVEQSILQEIRTNLLLVLMCVRETATKQ